MGPSLRLGGFQRNSSEDLGAIFLCVMVSASSSHLMSLVFEDSTGSSQWPTVPVALNLLACKNIPCHGRLAEATLTAEFQTEYETMI